MRKNVELLKNPVENKTDLIVSEKLIREKLKLIVKLFDEVYDLLTDEATIEREMEYCFEFERKVNKHLQEICEQCEKQNVKQNVMVHKDKPHELGADIKLPKMTIKKYNGDPLNWKQFIDSFTCAVDKKENLSNVEKMTYLVNLCEGEAEKTIGGLSISNENYGVAMDLLRERFGDQQILISANMNRLLNLEQSSGFVDIKEIRTLYDTIEIQVRSLRSIGLDEKNYGPMLVPIMSKLPHDFKLVLTRQFGKNPWEVTGILEALKLELEAREKVALTDSNIAETNSSSFLVNNAKKKIQFSCIFCGMSNHKSYQCQNISKPAARKDFLFKERRCFLCLKKGHQVINCNSTKSCFKCKEKHHSSICQGIKTNKRDNEKKEENCLQIFQMEFPPCFYKLQKQTLQNMH